MQFDADVNITIWPVPRQALLRTQYFLSIPYLFLGSLRFQVIENY